MSGPTVTLARVLVLIDEATDSIQRACPTDDVMERAMRAGAEAVLSPLRASMIKLAELESMDLEDFDARR